MPSILVERAVGETRALAIDANGDPFSLFVDRDPDLDPAPRWGDLVSGHVRHVESSAGGVFIELMNGAGAFWQVKSPGKVRGLSQGSEHLFRIKSEAREGKNAVVTLVDQLDSEPEPSAFERWQKALPIEDLEPNVLQDERAKDALQSEIDLAQSSHLTIDGGGRLTLDRTVALTAVDIDTAGRKTRGSASDRAMQVNRSAIGTLCRALEMRRLGGLVVIDLVAPLTERHGRDLREHMLANWKATSTRRADVLTPSRLGLMEASFAWRYRPLDEMYRAGSVVAEAVGLFRQIEREGMSNRMAHLDVSINPALNTFLRQTRFSWRSQLENRIGPRFTLRTSDPSEDAPFKVMPQ